MSLESVVLTGGQVRRGGVGEALGIKGLALAQRIASSLAPISTRVSILGDSPLPAFPFYQDRESGKGPMAALAEFFPKEQWVFVASCNLIGFSSDIVLDMQKRIGGRSAVIPTVQGSPQPLCALYSRECFDTLRILVLEGEYRMESWLRRLDALEVAAASLSTPAACFNVRVPTRFTNAVVNTDLRDERMRPDVKFTGWQGSDLSSV